MKKNIPLRQDRSSPEAGRADGGLGSPLDPPRDLALAMRLGRLGAWTLEATGRLVLWPLGLVPLDLPHPDRAGVPLREFLQVLGAGSREPLEHAVDACLAHGAPFDLEVVARQGRARTVSLRLTGEAERDPAGHVLRVRGAVQDVTLPREIADRAHETAQRLIATLESISEAFFTIDREWHFTYVNREAERLLRRGRAELLGRVLWDVFPQALESPFHREYERALADFQAAEFEAPYAPLGLWVEVKAFPSLHGLAVYFRDVTEERRVRLALSEREAEHRMLFESSIDAILRGSADGGIVQANPAACALFGLSEEALRQRGAAGLVDPGDPRLAALQAQRRRNGAAKGDLTMVRGDGARFEAEISSVEYGTADGEVRTYVILRDQTERLRARQEIEALNADLAERVRRRTAQLQAANTELKDFAHSLAHDLRALIATVDRFGEVLQRSLAHGGSPADEQHVARIRGAARQMDDFTQALLSLARISQAPLAWERVDLSALAQQALAALRERDRERQVDWEVQPGLIATGDARLLRLALDNLLGNAWKFTRRRAVARIRFGAHSRRSGELAYFVQDNGAGFDPARAHRLFGTFQRLHAAAEFEGTGIGLANVQRIVQRHGGRIWAESVPDLGATFFFTLAREGDPRQP